MAQAAAAVALEQILAREGKKYGAKVAGKLADKTTMGITGGVGKLLGGKKGKRIGRKVGGFLTKARREILGFKKGGMVKKYKIMRKK